MSETDDLIRSAGRWQTDRFAAPHRRPDLMVKSSGTLTEGGVTITAPVRFLLRSAPTSYRHIADARGPTRPFPMAAPLDEPCLLPVDEPSWGTEILDQVRRSGMLGCRARGPGNGVGDGDRAAG